MAGRPTPTFSAVKSVEDLSNLLHVSEEKLIIIDFHEEWCGPATALTPFLNQLWIDVEDAGKRITLVTASFNIPGVTKLAQQWSGTDIKVANQGCKPLFILLRHGHAVGAVDGCLTPVLRMYIDLNLPKLTKKDA